jgi:hypothetical protein
MKIMACHKEEESPYEVHKVIAARKARFPDLYYCLIVAKEEYAFGTPFFPPDLASHDYGV